MEIMRRYEGRLARLEAFARWWLREQELKRTRPERIAKWMRLLAPAYEQNQVSSRSQRPRDRALASERRAPLGPAQDDTPVVVPPPPPPPPAPFLSPPPPPRPAIEFIERGGGMSIAIDTATGQMATSAQVMAALVSKRPAGE